MSPLPPQAELDRLVGQRVVAVVLTANTVVLQLSAGDSVVAYAPFTLVERGGAARAITVPASDAALVAVIERAVAAVVRVDDVQLLLDFDDGAQLRLCADGTYESFELVLQGVRHIT